MQVCNAEAPVGAARLPVTECSEALPGALAIRKEVFMAKEKRSFKVTAREKAEWDAAALAELVLALARQRVVQRQGKSGSEHQAKPEEAA